MITCRYCDKEVSEPDATKTLSYWNAQEFVCHRSCKESGERDEAFDCQVIDADCNDCKYFLRAQAGIPRWTGRQFMISTNIVNGWCARFYRITRAWPHSWTGRECFTHRRQSMDLIKPKPPNEIIQRNPDHT